MNSPVKKSVGVFQNRGVCLQAFPRCPTPSLLLFLFCSRPNFRATRIFSRSTHSTSFARERLLRRLQSIKTKDRKLSVVALPFPRNLNFGLFCELPTALASCCFRRRKPDPSSKRILKFELLKIEDGFWQRRTGFQKSTIRNDTPYQTWYG